LLTGHLPFKLHFTARYVDRHAIGAQELVSDDSPNLESEEHTGCTKIEYGEPDLAVLNLLEIEVDARQEKRSLVPSR